jgi:pilus assembly protein FimV
VGSLKLIIIFWLASIAMPGISYALGLGEIEVSSFLNQPLKAEIKVISARPGEIDNLLVSLASRDSFARAGLSRSNHLSDLRFVVKKNEIGDQAIILVTTKDAIKEPFLNFLVEADWSKGRVLREFTVLLDPPFFADGAAPAPSSIVEESAVPMASSSPVSSEADSIQSTVTTAPSNVANNADLDSIVVKKGDALWTIASQFKDSKHSMGQVMLAMQRANPNAFSNNNINNLKIGAVLRAPTADELDQLNKQEAYALVLEQNGLWDSYVARVTGTSISIANDESSSDDNVKQNVNSDLSLLTPGVDGSESAGQGEGVNLSDLKNKLALAEEQLDAAQIEKQEMQSRIADLEARLIKFDELQKMVEIEEDSLAQLQSNQAEKIAKEDSIQSNLSLTPDVVVEKKVEVTPPTPVILTGNEQKEVSIFDGILPPGVIVLIPPVKRLSDDPLALGGLAAAAILLIGLVLYRRRKNSEGDDDALIVLNDVDLKDASRIDHDLAPVESAEGSIISDNNVNFDTVAPGNVFDEDDEDPKTAVTSQVDLADPDAVDSAAPEEQDDVLNEVDVYLAYGLYDNAEELLKQSLDVNPGRTDYRLKLLDTYFVTKNVDGFSNQAELFETMGGAGAPHWNKVQTMGYELAPDNALFSAGKDSNVIVADLDFVKPEIADRDSVASEDDTKFSATDLNLTSDIDDFTNAESVQALTEIDEPDDVADAPQLDNNLSDELDSLEFTLDDEEDDLDDISDINFDISDADDLDLGVESSELEDVSLDFDIDEVQALSSDFDSFESDPDLDSDLDSDEGSFKPTAIINTPIGESVTASKPEADFNRGTNDTSLTGIQYDVKDNGSVQLDRDESALEIDLNLEPLDLSIEDSFVDGDEDLSLDDSIDIKEDSLALDRDFSRENEEAGTGSFAPVDFDGPDETITPEEVDINDISDLMLPDDVDEVSTKLDLARAFIDMGDYEGARGSLDEVLAEGTDEQKAEAIQLLEKI